MIMENATFNKKKAVFTSKLDSNLRKKLKCYNYSINSYGSEIWTL